MLSKIHAIHFPMNKGAVCLFPYCISRKLFTLLELLIVIAIISILSALLLPAFKKAKDSANGILCLNNLKQTYLAVNMYCGDYNTKRIPSQIPDTAISLYWHHILLLTGYVQYPKGFSDSNIMSMTGNTTPAIFNCPSNKVSLDGSAWRGCHWGINGYLRGTNISTSWAPNKEINNPSRTCYFGEKRWNAYDNIYPAVASGNETYILFRHNNNTNVVYLDGHAKPLGYTVVPTSLTASSPEKYYFWLKPDSSPWK